MPPRAIRQSPASVAADERQAPLRDSLGSGHSSGSPGRDASLSPAEAEALFWVAFDWGTYRTPTEHARLTPDESQMWLHGYYRRVFLAAVPP